MPELASRRDPEPQNLEPDDLEQSEPQSRSVCQPRGLMTVLRGIAKPWVDYARSPVILPSIALSMLYLTVLSFGTQMTTYLLAIHFSPLQISVMKIFAVISELSATWFTPFLMRKIGHVRSGLWFINWQLGCIAVATGLLFSPQIDAKVATIGLVIGVIFSRLGLWGFDLCVQFLIQEVSG